MNRLLHPLRDLARVQLAPLARWWHEHLTILFELDSDPMTGAKTHPALVRDLRKLFLAERRDIVLVYFDADGLKRLNDRYGHNAGNAFIKEVATRLRFEVEQIDGTLYRNNQAADEFVALIPGITCADNEVDLMIRTMLVEVCGPSWQFQRHGIAISVSAGWSRTNISLEDLTDAAIESQLHNFHMVVVDMAEAAMKHSKRLPGSPELRTVRGNLEMLERARTIDHLVRDMIDTKRFSVHYQPIVRLTDRQVVGAEALMRPPYGWESLPWGDHPPSLSDLVERLESAQGMQLLWPDMVDKVARQLAHWKKRQPDLRLWASINVAPSQFGDPQFGATVLDCLAKHSVPADQLVLEVVERETMPRHIDVSEVVRRLSDQGVRLAVDDFGSELSNHQRIVELGFESIKLIKIDRSFIVAIEDAEQCRQLVANMVDLADRLGCEAIAEAVEHEGQAKILAELGCHYAQGNLFGEPIKDSHFVHHLDRRVAS